MGKGRRKISIKRIENLERRQVTFSKRRKGLIKKIRKLCVLSGSEIAFFTESPGGKIFSFGNPSPEAVIDRLFSDLSKTEVDSNILSDPKNQYAETKNEEERLWQELDAKNQYDETVIEVEMERKNEILPELFPKFSDGGSSLREISAEEEEEQYLIPLNYTIGGVRKKLESCGGGTPSTYIPESKVVIPPPMQMITGPTGFSFETIEKYLLEDMDFSF